MLYPKLCYNELCYKEVVVYQQVWIEKKHLIWSYDRCFIISSTNPDTSFIWSGCTLFAQVLLSEYGSVCNVCLSVICLDAIT